MLNDTVAQCIAAVRNRITLAEKKFGRMPGSVRLLAVSKGQPIQKIRSAIAEGQRFFGESYLQEALQKMDELSGMDLEWHFIGPIQSNKTRSIATHFQWVHSVDRLQIAQRLSDQRPENLPPLNVCIQVNISEEPTKSGIALPDLPDLAKQIAALPRLSLRGLMTIPEPSDNFGQQREAFHRLRQSLEELNSAGLQMDTLSMGMSSDLEAAIAEGATLVRVGTDIFGHRQT